jgi:hypothetical protein
MIGYLLLNHTRSKLSDLPDKILKFKIQSNRKHSSCVYGKDGGPLGIWKQWAPDAHGQAMKGGHFFPEENPDDTAILVKQFLSA